MDKENLDHDLVIYGSAATGLALRGDSDLDLTLVIRNLPPTTSSLEQSR